MQGTGSATDPLPDTHYLRLHYWWAYVHPMSVRIFERAWLVNLILFGNYERLGRLAAAGLGLPLTGRTLQVACAYGGLTERLLGGLSEGASFEVVDILPVQLENLRRKLPPESPVRLRRMDAAALQQADHSLDQVLLFFLLHEQPEDIRRRTLSEALRVLRPGGRLVIVDYARPCWWNPLRWLWRPVLALLEPFALDLWRVPVSTWLPAQVPVVTHQSLRLFGGLYQVQTLVRG